MTYILQTAKVAASDIDTFDRRQQLVCDYLEGNAIVTDQQARLEQQLGPAAPKDMPLYTLSTAQL